MDMLFTVPYILTRVSLLALAALGLVYAAVEIAPTVWRTVRRFASLQKIEAAVVAACVIGLVHYGATKSKFAYLDGVKANAADQSYTTNDTIHIAWVRNTSGGVYVPESATVYIDYRLSADTNGNWRTLAQTTVGAWSWDGTLADATNYDFNVWAYYIPPEPVHTNGVWVYRTMKDRAGKHPIPLRARIETNGKAIATPKEKRKDETEE